MPVDLLPGERIDDLGRAGLKIIQSSDGTAFGLDAVLLAHFVRVPEGGRAIDLGTGNGVIALLLTALSAATRVDALELDPALAARAGRSVTLNGLDDRVRVLQGDIRHASQLYQAQSYRVVVCNPPYFPVGAGRPSPSPARASGRSEISCTIDDVCSAARHLLGRHGRLFFVYRPDRLVDALTTCRRHGLEPKRLRLAQPTIARRPNLALIEAAPGARPGLVVEPTLVVRDGGRYSDEVRSLYGDDG